MRTTRTVALTLILVLTGALQGCAGIGKQDFACPGQPSKPLCLSTSEVYRMTDGYAMPHTGVARSQGTGASRRGNDVLTEIF
jgi:hypothetical protein